MAGHAIAACLLLAWGHLRYQLALRTQTAALPDGAADLSNVAWLEPELHELKDGRHLIVRGTVDRSPIVRRNLAVGGPVVRPGA